MNHPTRAFARPPVFLPQLVIFWAAGVLSAAEAPGPFDTSWLGFDTGHYLDGESAWWPTAMAVADLDGDGDPDVATANINNFLPIAPRVSIILNHGDGTFGAPTSLVTATETEDIVAADIDGDGDVDLVLTNTGAFGDGTTVSVLRNDGHATFSEEEVPVGAAGPFGLAAADLDGDGDIDVATANHGHLGQGNTISLLFNHGDGTFAAPVLIDAGAAPCSIAAGDLDGDDRPEIVLASGTSLVQSTAVRVFGNDGTGGFPTPPAMLQPLFSGGVFYPNVNVEDMDLDGDLDIVYSDLKLHVGPNANSLYGVAIYDNDGTGAFGAPEMPTFGAYTGAASGLVLADLTGDGYPDIVGPHDANEGWSLIASNGSGGYEASCELVSAEYPHDAAAVDVDGDGDLDLLVLAFFSQEVTVHYNPGNGDLGLPPHHQIFGLAYHLDAADVDGDGDLDVAASSGYASDGKISLLFNDGAGGFGAWPIDYVAPVYPSSVKLRDLDGNGSPDLLWADKYPPYSFRTRLNTEGGSFGPTQSWLQNFTCGISLNNDAIGAFDFDADGDLDVVLSENLGCPGISESGRRVFLNENDGSGGFTLVDIIVLNWNPYELMAGDVNGDGHLDLVTAGRTIDVLLGHGDLTFDPPVQQGLVDVPATNGVLVDLDDDGVLDVAVTVPWNSTIYESLAILRGRGDGTFTTPELYLATHSPNLAQNTSIVASDVDHDGDLDVLVGNYAANDVSLFENDGLGGFSPQVHIGVGARIRDLFSGDFSGDGTADLAAMVTMPQNGAAVAITNGRGPSPLHGDVNGDGAVDVDDLLEVIVGWGACPTPPTNCPADVDGNGVVDVDDLLLIILNWT